MARVGFVDDKFVFERLALPPTMDSFAPEKLYRTSQIGLDLQAALDMLMALPDDGRPRMTLELADAVRRHFDEVLQDLLESSQYNTLELAASGTLDWFRLIHEDFILHARNVTLHPTREPHIPNVTLPRLAIFANHLPDDETEDE
jgi:hypothetical protein